MFWSDLNSYTRNMLVLIQMFVLFLIHTVFCKRVYMFAPDNSLELFGEPDLKVINGPPPRIHIQNHIKRDRATVMNDRMEVRRQKVLIATAKSDNGANVIKRPDFVEKQEPKIPQNPDFGQCCMWAKQGECSDNAYFMKALCSSACGFINCDDSTNCDSFPVAGCTPAYSNRDVRLYAYTAGKIHSQDCCTRASRGDCWKYYSYMSKHCKRACQDATCAVYATPWVYHRKQHRFQRS